MLRSESGRISKRAIAIQLLLVAGVIAFFKLYLPHLERTRAAAEVAAREERIEKFFNSLVREDSSREVEAPTARGEERVHPQSLRSMPSVQEVQEALGPPDTSSTDFAGGLHLAWRGSPHSLEACFNHGRLYCLKWEDLHTGHGAMVFESSSQWHPF